MVEYSFWVRVPFESLQIRQILSIYSYELIQVQVIADGRFVLMHVWNNMANSFGMEGL